MMGVKMSVSIKEVKTTHEMREFTYFPEKIHKNHFNWVPPIYADERACFCPEKNKALTYCDCKLALAKSNGKAIGRIAGIINHRYNRHWQSKTARFGYFECPEDPEVAKLLLKFVEKWASDRMMHKIIGPMGFTDHDPEGFLIDGFEHPPNLVTNYNFKYVPYLLEKSGYRKEIDYVVYKVDFARGIPDFFRKVYNRVRRKGDYTLVEFTKQKQLAPYIRPMFTLMNECFENLYGYSALELIEMDNLANRYLPIVDPRFVKIVTTKGNEVIGFIIGIPNMAEGIRKARGRLFPFGFLKILRARKKSKKLDLYIGGIKEKYRGKGLDALMGYSVIKSAIQAGFEYMDSHHELETNLRMRAEMEKIGGTIYKRFRIYQKDL
jgi:hypothetical protein